MLFTPTTKSLVVITVFMCVLFYENYVNNDISRKEPALLDKQEQEQTIWKAYYERLIQETKLKKTIYNINENHGGEQFYEEMEENMKTVVNYTAIIRMKQKYVDIYNTFQESVATGNRSDKYPVIVTASSSNRFAMSLAMIKSVKENLLSVYKEMKFIFFDLGLTKDELSIVKAFCNCEVRPFPFFQYSPFVSKLLNYAWKPIVIYMMLREFNFVMWADASLKFNGNKQATDNFFLKAKETGILGQIRPCKIGSIVYIKEETFRYLNKTPCRFYLNRIDANLITIWKTTFTWKYIVQP